MTQAVIRTEQLGKQYRIGSREPSGQLREVLSRALRSPLSVLRRKPRETFWALKDVSFEVREGEILGLIGRNGSGKTTLLKILSRITRPTTGWGEIHGQVGSLLEVGTGFHPELTGRENTYLSGAILGMRKREIQHKFDEIVAFAELEKFIDTPVKHYSSGMYVRLAFAVAAHLEPEILLVDEVLAVGDINFQKKCLGKMGDVARAGRTVVLVSHNMSAILALCSRAVLLEAGSVRQEGSVTEVTSRYLEDSIAVRGNGSDLRDLPRRGSGKARFTSITIRARNHSGAEIPVAYTGCDLLIELEIESQSDFEGSNVAAIIYDATGYRLVDVNTAQKGRFLSLRGGEKARAAFELREVLLKPGRYSIGLWLGRDVVEEIDDIQHATAFQVADDPASTKQTIVYPGAYLCRFETELTSF